MRVPDVPLNDGPHSHSSASVCTRSNPTRPRQRWAPRSTSATDTSTPPAVRERARRRRGYPCGSGSIATTCSSPRRSTTATTSTLMRDAHSTRACTRSSPTMSTCSSSTGRCRHSTTRTSRPWSVLEEFAGDGRARTIGVSNFHLHHLERLARETDTVPAVNQVEVNPYFTNEKVRAYGKEHAIATEAWSPIARGTVLDDDVDPAHRRQSRQVTGTGGPALAHSAWRHCVSEVGVGGSDEGQLRFVRLRVGWC